MIYYRAYTPRTLYMHLHPKIKDNVRAALCTVVDDLYLASCVHENAGLITDCFYLLRI